MRSWRDLTEEDFRRPTIAGPVTFRSRSWGGSAPSFPIRTADGPFMATTAPEMVFTYTDGEAVIMLAFQASGTGSTPVQCSISFSFPVAQGEIINPWFLFSFQIGRAHV